MDICDFVPRVGRMYGSMVSDLVPRPGVRKWMYGMYSYLCMYVGTMYIFVVGTKDA